MTSVKIVAKDDVSPIELSEEFVNSLETIKTAAAVTEGDVFITLFRLKYLIQKLPFKKYWIMSS